MQLIDKIMNASIENFTINAIRQIQKYVYSLVLKHEIVPIVSNIYNKILKFLHSHYLGTATTILHICTYVPTIQDSCQTSAYFTPVLYILI